MQIVNSCSIAHDKSLDETFRIMSELGIREIDLLLISDWAHISPFELIDDFDGTVQETDRLLKQYDLEPVSANVKPIVELFERDAELVNQRNKELDAIFRFLAEFEIKVASLQPPLRGDEEFLESTFTATVQSVKEAVEIATGHGVTLALEPHINSAFDTSAKSKRLFEVYPDVKVAYDPSHFIKKGEGVAETDFILDNTVHVHLRDANDDGIMALYGEGITDFPLLFSLLKEKGYGGMISIEYLPGDCDIETLKRNLLEFKGYLETLM